jgi:hypothetical protein
MKVKAQFYERASRLTLNDTYNVSRIEKNGRRIIIHAAAGGESVKFEFDLSQFEAWMCDCKFHKEKRDG